MSTVWVYSIVSVVAVSLISFVGAFTLSIDIEKLRKVLLYFVSFAAGALLGDAFVHLLPESVAESYSTLQLSSFILLGIIIFFILEKIIFWRHCHLPTTEEHPHPVGLINLVGDALHNFIDGVIIAGSFLVSPTLGFTTTLAVILHEIPQEIGDFTILIHAGYSRGRALLYNFYSALTAVLGSIATLIIGGTIHSLTAYIVPLTIGGFVYIAASDLLPELTRERSTMRSELQLFSFLLGVAVMDAFLFIGK